MTSIGYYKKEYLEKRWLRRGEGDAFIYVSQFQFLLISVCVLPPPPPMIGYAAKAAAAFNVNCRQTAARCIPPRPPPTIRCLDGARRKAVHSWRRLDARNPHANRMPDWQTMCSRRTIQSRQLGAKSSNSVWNNRTTKLVGCLVGTAGMD